MNAFVVTAARLWKSFGFQQYFSRLLLHHVLDPLFHRWLLPSSASSPGSQSGFIDEPRNGFRWWKQNSSLKLCISLQIRLRIISRPWSPWCPSSRTKTSVQRIGKSKFSNFFESVYIQILCFIRFLSFLNGSLSNCCCLAMSDSGNFCVLISSS